MSIAILVIARSAVNERKVHKPIAQFALSLTITLMNRENVVHYMRIIKRNIVILAKVAKLLINVRILGINRNRTSLMAELLNINMNKENTTITIVLN